MVFSKLSCLLSSQFVSYTVPLFSSVARCCLHIPSQAYKHVVAGFNASALRLPEIEPFSYEYKQCDRNLNYMKRQEGKLSYLLMEET